MNQNILTTGKVVKKHTTIAECGLMNVLFSKPFIRLLYVPIVLTF